MKKSAIVFLLICQFAGADIFGAGEFSLQAVRKGGGHFGPFDFENGSKVVVAEGVFNLDLLDGHAFKLREESDGTVYGVYELVPGRIIDVGGTLYEITDIRQPDKVVSANITAAERASFFANSAFGLKAGLLENTKYDWEVNGLQGGASEDMKRNSISVSYRKSVVRINCGMILSSEWNGKIAGAGLDFENAEMKEGSGWFAGIGLRVPVFREGGWSGDIFGDVSYSSEKLSLTYGGWNSETVVNTSVTNGATNVTSTTNYKYLNYDEDATLTETIVTLGAELEYQARVWFIYGGIKVLPWSDTSLDATIVNGDSRYVIEFDRSDPVMGYGGAGVIVKGVKCYLEVEGGGVNAVRLGIMKEF
jgi:hypothetical protein